MMKTRMLVLCLAAVVSSGCGSPTVSDSQPSHENGGGTPLAENGVGTPQASATDHAVELPKDFPSDIPIYPGSTPTVVLSNAEVTIVSFETDASVSEVTSYYEDKLTENGWSDPAGSFKSAESALFQAKKENRLIRITISKEKNATLITMTL